MALGPEPRFRGAVVEWLVIIPHLAEEVDLAAGEQQGGCDRVYGRVPPALVEEPAGAIEVVEEGGISLAAHPARVGNLKVGPEVAHLDGKEEGRGLV